MTKVVSIRVPARWLSPDGAERTEPAVFRLGPGPCGKTVVALDYKAVAGVFSIVQVDSEGGAAHFLYPFGQLTGRVEVETAG